MSIATNTLAYDMAKVTAWDAARKAAKQAELDAAQAQAATASATAATTLAQKTNSVPAMMNGKG